MTMPQQLQWNKRRIEYLAAKKIEEGLTDSLKSTELKFDPNADLSSMSATERSAWKQQKIKHDYNKKRESCMATPLSPAATPQTVV